MSDNIRRLAAAVSILFLLVSVGVGYWQILAAEALATDPYNPRGYAAALSRQRGAITDRDGVVIAESELQGDVFRRKYASAAYEPFLGYATLRFGAAGLEHEYARSLVGQDPADPLGAIRRRYLNEQAPPGSVRLAISARLQQVAERALGNRAGAIIALEPRTGEILASLSNPRYDPNPLGDPAQQAAAFERLRNDPQRPLLDRAAQGLYPPGSTFKLITGAAGIETGVIDPGRRVRVDSPWQADPSWGNYSVRSVTNAHREFDLNQAYMFSENIYFAMAGVRMGGDRLADYAGRFMIGKDLSLDGQASRSQLSATGSLDRGPVLVADTSFGQGELLISPLHMALIAATFANGGVMPTPHYALDVRDASGAVIRRIGTGTLAQPIRSDTARRITDAMIASVEGPGAFAFGARIPGVRVAGKTGSAENPAGAPHGWFVGFAPADQPTIAVAVLIEHTPRGGEDAAPLGAMVMRSWLGR
jgi:peptidoglycan glycosyltransferase